MATVKQYMDCIGHTRVPDALFDVPDILTGHLDGSEYIWPAGWITPVPEVLDWQVVTVSHDRAFLCENGILVIWKENVK